MPDDVKDESTPQSTTPVVVRRGRSKVELTFWAVFIVALIVGVNTLVGTSPARVSGAKVLDSAPRTSVPVTSTSLSSTVALVSVPRSQPRKLLIPSIGVSTLVGSLGLQANGQVMVPSTVHTVGWYRLGPTPGQVGASVILGHVDSYVGPGVFFNLKNLKSGARISVVLANGAIINFQVVKVVEYSKSDFPDRLVYTSQGARELNLVTCGGTFDHSTGHYESNIVVFSRYTGTSR